MEKDGAIAMQDKLLSPEEIQGAQGILNSIQNQLNAMLLGREELHRLVLVGLLANGHLLLEGLPGLGKTALVKALSEILALDAKRVQFTPDLMPGDILGSHILQTAADGSREMAFHAGPVFCNILLADEINRASPKTQSAMLETMQERSVTLMGVTRKLPSPFFVLASQNPIELEGTYPLPEAQLDRFLFKLNVGDVSAETLAEIITTRSHGAAPKPTEVIGKDRLEQILGIVGRIFLAKPVASYIARLVSLTHPQTDGAPQVVKDYVTFGASPRAAIAIAEASRAMALISGRPSAGFEDVKRVAEPALNHRVILNYKARFDGVTTAMVIKELLDTVDPANLGLPNDIVRN